MIYRWAAATSWYVVEIYQLHWYIVVKMGSRYIMVRGRDISVTLVHDLQMGSRYIMVRGRDISVTLVYSCKDGQPLHHGMW